MNAPKHLQEGTYATLGKLSVVVGPTFLPPPHMAGRLSWTRATACCVVVEAARR
jgi:hypothetical protein